MCYTINRGLIKFVVEMEKVHNMMDSTCISIYIWLVLACKQLL